MRNIVVIAVGVVVALGALGLLFGEAVYDQLKQRATADMFVADDRDTFDPGLPIGEPFPPIQAFYEGAVIGDLRSFPIDKGMVFIANRSVDW